MQKTQAISIESYMHRMAKSVVSGWLKDAECWPDYAKFGPFSWRSGGIYEEYPVCRYAPSFAESISHMDHDEWSSQGAWDERGFKTPPSYEICCLLGMSPVVIYDIVALHKGAVAFAIEIVHRNDLDKKKLAKLKALPYVPVYRVSAEWVMHQIGIPERFDKFEKVF